jgi:hypothetical protein
MDNLSAITKTKDPLTNAKAIVTGAFNATKGQTDDERIERITYAIASIFRDTPIEDDGLPMFLVKMQPGNKGCMCRLHVSTEEIAAMLTKHFNTVEVLTPVILALANGKHTKVISL